METVCLHRCLRNRCWLEPLQEMIIHTKDCLWQLPSKSLFQRLRRESGLAELEEGRAHLEAIRLGWPSALYSEPGLQRARVIGEKDCWLILPIELFPRREEELSLWLHPHPSVLYSADRNMAAFRRQPASCSAAATLIRRETLRSPRRHAVIRKCIGICLPCNKSQAFP